MRYAWFVNYLFLVVKSSFSWSFSDLTSHYQLTSCAVGLVTVSDLWDVSAYIKSTVLSVQEVWNSKKVTKGPQGTVALKSARPVHVVEKGLNKQRINSAEVNPTHKIEPKVCLTLQVESQRGVSHFKHPSCTVLEYARDLGNTMCESLKRISQWSAYYFTHRRSYYPLPENNISLRDIPKMSPMPPKEMSQADQTLMREWA